MLARYIEEIIEIKSKKLFAKKQKEVLDFDILDEELQLISNYRILLKNTLYKALQNNKLSKIDKKAPKINLKKMLIKRHYNGFEILDILDKFPNSNRNIGSIPKVFLEKVSNKKETSKKIFDLFAKYSLILNFDYSLEKDDTEYIDCDCDSLANELSGLIDKNVKIKYIGHGCNGNGFKINIDSEKFFYKVYYPLGNKDTINKHGATAEVSSAVYAQTYSSKGVFAKFFFGKIASKTSKDGFLITEFIDKNKDLRDNSIRNLRINYITLTPNELCRSDNTLCGKFVDFGGIEESNIKELQNPAMRKMIRIILNSINYRFDKKTFSSCWKVHPNNIISLRNYSKNKDYLYKNALKIIKRKIYNIPNDIIEKLNNINSFDNIETTEQLSIKDLLTNNLRTLFRIVRYYKIPIRSVQKSINGSMGYIILDLGNNKLVIYLFTKHKIYQIRFEEQMEKEFKILHKLCDDEILNSSINIENFLI